MSEDKYKVVSPEIMQEPVILDSDDDDIGETNHIIFLKHHSIFMHLL